MKMAAKHFKKVLRLFATFYPHKASNRQKANKNNRNCTAKFLLPKRGENVMDRTELLARKARKGDTEAYGELIRIHKDYFYRNAFCYVKNVEQACDIFQEAVTVGMLSIKDLKKPEYFRTWMTRIIYNCANELHRKNAREIYLEDEQQTSKMTVKSNGELSREEVMDLHNAVDSLEEPYRTIVKQKYFQGMKISEISIRMGRPEGTVKSDLSRAKKQLRVMLKEG